ncbi:MAG: universal stress protein [Bacteroidota bacterium]
MKRILFPTDFSDTAHHAFVYALELAAAFDAEIITLSVYRKPDLPGELYVASNLQKIYNEMDLAVFNDQKEATALLRNIAQQNGQENVNLDHLLVEGEVKATILATAEKENIDLIVMGTDGATFFEQVFTGSVTGEIMEKATCPVLAIPDRSKYDGQLDHLGVCTNFLDSDHKVIETGLQWAESLQAKVKVVHVDTTHTEAYKSKMEAFQKPYAGKENLEFVGIDGLELTTALGEYAENNKIDLLIMQITERNFLQELMHQNIAKQMTYHRRVPILAIQY